MNHVFVSQNGNSTVHINTFTGKVTHTQYMRDGNPWVYPGAVETPPWTIEKATEYVETLHEDNRYIDVSNFTESQLKKWRAYASSAGERTVISNEPAGSAWKAMGKNMVGEGSYEDYFGMSPNRR